MNLTGKGSPSSVYPRECGATFSFENTVAVAPGLSPRVRGNQCQGYFLHGVVRSIPASAGQPSEADAEHCCSEGLSPRVRGNPSLCIGGSEAMGSIPASAGQPCHLPNRQTLNWVYPRECGATLSSSKSSNPKLGLSPRVRGNPQGIGNHIIPRQGLSPRVRGNLPLSAPAPVAKGSIPASAGQPASIRSRASRQRVYPRECRATDADQILEHYQEGLSPRVRGNPRLRLDVYFRWGSIPASAGQPHPIPAR